MKNFTFVGTLISLLIAGGLVLKICKLHSYELGTTRTAQKIAELVSQ